MADITEKSGQVNGAEGDNRIKGEQNAGSDTSAKRGRITEILTVAGVIVSLLVLYIANSKMPFKMDDEWYATNLVTGRALSGFGDIWESQVWHFFHWGGRSIAHAQLQLILWAGPVAADLLNVAVTVLLVALVCKMADAPKLIYGLMTLGLLVILNANWSQTLLWQSGVANYLYMTTWILLFLLCYFRTLERPEAKKLPGIFIFIAPLGLFAGWSNENMGPAVWLGTLAIIWYLWKKEKKWYPWMLAGNLFCLLGSCLVILAPGNFVRNVEAEEQVAGKGLLWRVFLRCFSVANGLFYYLLFAAVLLVLLLFIYCSVLHKKLRRSDWCLLLMALLSWGAMLLSPHYPDRASFGTLVLMLIPMLHMIAGIWKEQKNVGISGTAVALFVWLCGMFPLCTYICQMLGWIQ